MIDALNFAYDDDISYAKTVRDLKQQHQPNHIPTTWYDDRDEFLRSLCLLILYCSLYACRFIYLLSHTSMRMRAHNHIKYVTHSLILSSIKEIDTEAWRQIRVFVLRLLFYRSGFFVCYNSIERKHNKSSLHLMWWMRLRWKICDQISCLLWFHIPSQQKKEKETI